MEFWARYRFDLQSEHVPWDMRENIALSSLDAKKLKPNYQGVSRKNVAFFTNQLGFRCPESRANVKPKLGIVLGGDSFTFGMYHPYEESWPYFFEKHLGVHGDRRWAHIQAIPGGSPSMTFDHLFGPQALAKKVPSNLLLQSISHYDHVDNVLYEQDKEDLADPKRRLMRQFKVSISPYLVSMLQLKLRHFMQKDERSQLLFAADYSMRGKQKLMREVLSAMKVGAEKQGWRFAIYFMPDRRELLTAGWDHSVHMVSMIKDLDIPFYNLERALEEDASIDHQKVFRDDGLHLNAYGAKIVGQKCAEFVLESGL
jgi:hypothetical protein